MARKEHVGRHIDVGLKASPDSALAVFLENGSCSELCDRTVRAHDQGDGIRHLAEPLRCRRAEIFDDKLRGHDFSVAVDYMGALLVHLDGNVVTGILRALNYHRSADLDDFAAQRAVIFPAHRNELVFWAAVPSNAAAAAA